MSVSDVMRKVYALAHEQINPPGLLPLPKQVRFDDLALGDRFRAVGALWTKLGADTARRHSSASRKLGAQGYGYEGDALCSFEPDTQVVFVPPGQG